MAVDTKFDELKNLRIDRSANGPNDAPKWSYRFILAGIGVLVVLGIIAVVIRMFSSSAPEVQVVRPSAVSNAGGGDTVLSAAGYIVAHHTIDVNSKVTGRIAWIGERRQGKRRPGSGTPGRSGVPRSGAASAGQCSCGGCPSQTT